MKKILKTLKERINNYLKKMEEANKKTYGSGRLDCCDLNKKTKNKEESEAHS